MPEETRNDAERGALERTAVDEANPSACPGWREIFRQAFDKARQAQPPVDRRDLGRDRSRSLFVLAGAAIALLLLFLGVFSSDRTKSTTGRLPETPDLGRRIAPGQQRPGQAGSVTPLLSAQTGESEASSDRGVTPEEVGRTARPRPIVSAAGNPKSYALGNISFSEPSHPEPPTGQPSQATADDLRKPSLVFVQSGQNPVRSNVGTALRAEEESLMAADLPAGTRLVARLQSVVSSAIRVPVVAAVEDNYERDGEIVVAAGARVIGSLAQVDPSGYVAIRFDTIEMPDGSAEKFDATAMSLGFGPLKGAVSGKRTGTNFLVRTFTGLGQAATYLAGSGGLTGPLSESALLRDRLATNIGNAGDQELNSLTFNQKIVVTVPANTRFYVVAEKGTSTHQEDGRPAATQQANDLPLPTAEELRQLLQLRRELSDTYQPAGPQSAASGVPQP
jgi:Bacterial conjugation TrbI-like protein